MNFELWTLLCFIYAWTSILLGLAFLCMTAFVLFIALQRHVPHSTSFTLCFFVYCVASALLVVGRSSDLVSTLADALYIHQLILKCRRLAYGSFQSMRVMGWPCYWSRANNGCQKEDKKLFQHSQHAPFSLCTHATNIELCRELVCSLPYMLLVQPL